MTSAITARRLFDGEHWLDDQAVLLDGEHISAVLPRDALAAADREAAIQCDLLAPGFIDLQVNGGGGVMLNNDPTPEGLAKMTTGHRGFGTTSMMPTLISDTPDTHQAGARAIASAIAEGNRSVLGLHIEGPFFDLEKRGTHKADMIREADDDDIAWLESLTGFPVILTLAPEHTHPGQIAALTRAGIRVCAGHTNASHEQLRASIAEGLRGFTHLFNAMSPLSSREPGAVGTALDDEHTWAGVIADGFHVHPASIRIAQRCKPRGKLFLVSDAMATVGSESLGFEIYGERIEVDNGRLINAEGALAGSAIGLIDAVRICHQQVGLALDECLRMASLYPAQFLELDNTLGRIQVGHRADLVHIDDSFTVLDTWVAGQHQPHHPTPDRQTA